MGLELLIFQSNYDQIYIELLFDLYIRFPFFMNICHMSLQTIHTEKLSVTIITSLGYATA